MEKTFAMISLGCAKNLVNSEQMLYLMSEAGFSLVPEAEGADLAIVNTCGFIDAAKTEAIDNILELAELKKQGKLGGLIVTGCLAERYKDSILSELPEIDAVLGVGNFKDIVAAANTVMEGRNLSLFGSNSAPVDEIPRVVSTGPAWAYLRIAEGCNNFCAFCAIPYIRGRYRSRSMENILEEANDLAAHGVKELIVIAQDITRYGTDLYGKRSLAALCRELTKLHEDTVRTTLAQAAAFYRDNEPRGEYVLVVAGREKQNLPALTLEEGAARVLALRDGGMKLKEAVRRVPDDTGLPRNALYDTALKA